MAATGILVDAASRHDATEHLPEFSHMNRFTTLLAVAATACPFLAAVGAAPSTPPAGTQPAAPPAAAAPLAADPARKPLAPVLAEVLRTSGAPGIAAAVVRDGKVIGIGVSGVRVAGDPDPIQESDSFVIASCTKAMTRLLLARMADAGELGFNTPLPQLLPGVTMREEYKGMTVTNLAQHTAGIPAYTRITPRDTPIVFELRGTPMEQRSAFAAHVLNEAPAAPPGTRFVYSNASYALLGNIAERRAGKPWEELMRERVFQPLGMEGVSFGRPHAEPGKPVVVGHRRNPAGGFEPARTGPPLDGLFAPAGAVCLPIEQFARFAAAEVAVEGGTMEGFLTRATLGALPGLLPADMAKREGGPFYGGEGSYSAAFVTWPSKNLAVVVCTNAGDGDAVCAEAIRAVLEACAPDVPFTPAAAGPAGAPGARLGIQMRWEHDGRVIVDDVADGGRAASLGFKKDDEITSVDGKGASEWTPEDLGAAMRRSGAKVVLLRAGKPIEITVP
jgi:CubicO group peptidase (beta-lactamase class C family)